MTRRGTTWWSGVLATSPGAFALRPEGDRLLGLLADWWIAQEGLLDGRPRPSDQTRRAVARRYRQCDFYALLADSGFPEFGDRDEHAIDTVLRVFHGWASGDKASALVGSVGQKEAARGKILRGLDTTNRPRGLGLIAHQRSQDEFGSLVVYEVHEQVHARAKAQLQAEVKAQLRAEL
jgi:hypothetical protein